VPFTPFHFGPGILVKSAAPKRFSLSAHMATQVVIDCETLYHMIAHTKPDHRFFHTLVGASLVSSAVAVAMVIGAPSARGRWTWLDEDLDERAIWIGALFGGVSHALLDSMYHRDAMPFWPWSRANPFLSPHAWAPILCVVTGLAGLAIWAVRASRKRA
jgi:membrane-bound metal-dependent hydrolase YbcI (DUF457 family)